MFCIFTIFMFIYSAEKEHLQVNVTSLEAPIFTVENLPHNTAFTLNAFSSNAKGRSDSVTLRTATTAHAEKHTTNGKSKWKKCVLHFVPARLIYLDVCWECQRVFKLRFVLQLSFVCRAYGSGILFNLAKLTSFFVFIFFCQRHHHISAS